MIEENNQEKANINALFDSVYVIDQALLFDQEGKQKQQTLRANVHHLEQQLRKQVYLDALSAEDLATVRDAIARGKAAFVQPS